MYILLDVGAVDFLQIQIYQEVDQFSGSYETILLAHPHRIFIYYLTEIFKVICYDIFIGLVREVYFSPAYEEIAPPFGSYCEAIFAEAIFSSRSGDLFVIQNA